VSIPKKMRDKLKERASYCCELCGEPSANNAHHRRNQSQGGQDVLSNLLWLCGDGCRGCHGAIGADIDAAKLLGHTIQGTRTVPLAVAVTLYTNTDLRDNLEVYLTDDGDYSMSPPCCCGLPVDRCFRCCLGSHLLCERPVAVGVDPNQEASCPSYYPKWNRHCDKPPGHEGRHWNACVSWTDEMAGEAS
jgi:hypothetical protein